MPNKPTEKCHRHSNGSEDPPERPCCEGTEVIESYTLTRTRRIRSLNNANPQDCLIHDQGSPSVVTPTPDLSHQHQPATHGYGDIAAPAQELSGKSATIAGRKGQQNAVAGDESRQAKRTTASKEKADREMNELLSSNNIQDGRNRVYHSEKHCRRPFDKDKGELEPSKKAG